MVVPHLRDTKIKLLLKDKGSRGDIDQNTGQRQRHQQRQSKESFVFEQGGVIGDDLFALQCLFVDGAGLRQEPKAQAEGDQRGDRNDIEIPIPTRQLVDMTTGNGSQCRCYSPDHAIQGKGFWALFKAIDIADNG